MQKWEYTEVVQNAGGGRALAWDHKGQGPRQVSFKELLNNAGKDGWELVSIKGSETYTVGYLKRPIP